MDVPHVLLLPSMQTLHSTKAMSGVDNASGAAGTPAPNRRKRSLLLTLRRRSSDKSDKDGTPKGSFGGLLHRRRVSESPVTPDGAAGTPDPSPTSSNNRKSLSGLLHRRRTLEGPQSPGSASAPEPSPGSGASSSSTSSGMRGSIRNLLHMSTATYFGPSFKPQTAAKPSKAQEARSGVQHAMPSRPEHYAHWGVLHRLHSLRYHKYHCGIHEQIIGFFANVADGPTETYDLTGCTVLVGFTQRRNEFVVRRPKEDGAAKESLWVLRCGSEVEVEAWAAAITKAAHYIVDKMHEQRRRERRDRRLALALQQQEVQLMLEEEAEEATEREALHAQTAEWEAELEGKAAPFDWEARLAELLTHPNRDKPLRCTSVEGEDMRVACSRCTVPYREGAGPLLLDCHHDFCAACVADCADATRVVCEACGTETPVPEAGLSGLPSNYMLLDLRLDYLPRLREMDRGAAVDAIDAVCPLCVEPFLDTTPLLLRCGHTVCDRCMCQLVATTKSKCNKRLILCPECRAPTDLSTHAVSVNYTVEQAVAAVLDCLSHNGDVPRTPSMENIRARLSAGLLEEDDAS